MKAWDYEGGSRQICEGSSVHRICLRTMVGGKFSFANANVFRHHKPIPEEDMRARVLPGLDGAFRERLVSEGFDPKEPTVGTLVQFRGETGMIEGCRTIKCGSVKPAPMNTKDIWPEGVEAKLVIPEFDISIFPDYNGMMYSRYVRVPYKIQQQHDGKWKTTKAGEHADQGYGDLIMRINFLVLSPGKVKFLVSGLATSMEELAKLGENTTRHGYPTIKIHEGKASLITEEMAGQRYGLGLQPFYLPSDANLDEQGDLDLDSIHWPSSWNVKAAVSSLLRTSVLPNWHTKFKTWEDAVKANKYERRIPEERWPEPLEENDRETEVEEDSESEGNGILEFEIPTNIGKISWQYIEPSGNVCVKAQL